LLVSQKKPLEPKHVWSIRVLSSTTRTVGRCEFRVYSPLIGSGIISNDLNVLLPYRSLLGFLVDDLIRMGSRHALDPSVRALAASDANWHYALALARLKTLP
jgi:hypothetical protein